jgi:hypothetical protein
MIVIIIHASNTFYVTLFYQSHILIIQNKQQDSLFLLKTSSLIYEDVTDPLAGADKGKNLSDRLTICPISIPVSDTESREGCIRSASERWISFKTPAPFLLLPLPLQEPKCGDESIKCPARYKNIVLIH